MSDHSMRKVFVLGAVSILGIFSIQAYWLSRAFSLEDSEFHQTVTISLYSVAEKIAAFNDSELPKHNLIQRKASNNYAVNINDRIDANILEDYLIREFEQNAIDTDFEYAVYDCHSQELVYGNYCKISDLEETQETSGVLPTFDDLTYYFVVKFPSRNSYLLSGMYESIGFSLITLMALGFFIYSIWVILHQKRLSALQKDFINNMTHEFKTPIASIKIAADVLRSSELMKTEPRLSKYSQIIIDQNERLNNQVEKVLNLARLEQESFKLKKEKFDVISLLNDIVQAENLKVQENKAGQIRLEVSGEKTQIEADKLHFSNVVHNLIDNALKYCKRVPQILVRSTVNERNLVLDFVDNGIGISKEDFDKLFQKFYRVSTGNIHDVKGFGLGLYYVKNICRAHGWTIDVSSNPSSGSTFSLRIPLNNG